MNAPAATNILDTIVEQKRQEIALLPDQKVQGSALRNALATRGDTRDFAAALRRPRNGSVALIAEVKKASPSAGVICRHFDPVRIARTYESAGADCVSVLTDEKFFQGSLAYLKEIRHAVALPLLRKDFIIDERQILEAIKWGADAILLIVAILTDHQLKRFQTLANDAGIAALVEVHDETELARALAAGAKLLGVNNRNLKTFEVNLATTERLARLVRETVRAAQLPLLVAESGINARADVERVTAAGAQAILVGEALMREGHAAEKIRQLLRS